jgi:uncharacterized protein (DUF427 family)
MPKAVLNDVVLASSDRCEQVEGNYYFPPDALNSDYFTPSATHTHCSWKGQASYYNVTVNGTEIKDAAWYYPATTTERAKAIEGYVAFYKTKVKIEA